MLPMFSSAADYWELCKPSLTSLVLISVAFGFALASPGDLDWILMAHVLFGVALTAGGGGALNQYLEIAMDSKMKRTQNRPLPTGRMQPGQALVFGSLVSTAGILYLVWATDITTAFLGALSLGTYIFAYTLLKPRTSLNTFVGGITGSLPPVMGWTAATGGTISTGAWVLFSILFVWQMPHFFSLAWLFEKDYVRAGFRMVGISNGNPGLTLKQIFLYGVIMVPVSLLPTLTGLTGKIYFSFALVLSLLFVGFSIRLLWTRSRSDGWLVFFVSLGYLPCLLGAMLWDKI